MKTKAYCPTCEFPFSFWRLACAYSPFAFYCVNCNTRIVIGRATSFMWGLLVGIVGMTFLLANFIIPRDMVRLAVLVVLWLASVFVISFIVALLMVNMGQFYAPDESVDDNAV